MLITERAHPPTPHPFPYQGSKRGIAKFILPHFPAGVRRLIEPFCGAGAVSIAAAAAGLAERFVLNDLNRPLMDLWSKILQQPEQLAGDYAKLWTAQQPDPRQFFLQIRDEFNQAHLPHHLLYLLARIVKGSVRYSADGQFNQSPDNRRSGMQPGKMRLNILEISRLLAGKTNVSSADYRQTAGQAAARDLVYMDPPYQGTSFTRDRRYYSGVAYDDFVDALQTLNGKGVSYLISYDGATGTKTHGRPLPASLGLRHLHINAGRSSQATLLGGREHTIESLYLSPALIDRLNVSSFATREKRKAFVMT